jgi:hypothetical protein
MSVLIVALLVWVVVIPLAVMLGTSVLASVGTRRRLRAERRYAALSPARSAQILRFPSADRSVRPAATAR